MAKPDIHLLIRSGCPHAGLARQRLAKVLRAHGLSEHHFQEVDMDGPDCPAAYRLAGSPTILIGNEDVSRDGAPAADGPTCRIYPGGDGAPSLELIADAFKRWHMRAGEV